MTLPIWRRIAGFLIGNAEVLRKPDRSFPFPQSMQQSGKVDHIPGSPAAEAVKAAVHFHAGRAVIVEWTADHAVSPHPDSIEKAALAATDAVTFLYQDVLTGEGGLTALDVTDFALERPLYFLTPRGGSERERCLALLHALSAPA